MLRFIIAFIKAEPSAAWTLNGREMDGKRASLVCVFTDGGVWCGVALTGWMSSLLSLDVRRKLDQRFGAKIEPRARMADKGVAEAEIVRTRAEKDGLLLAVLDPAPTLRLDVRLSGGEE